jgi:butyrate kinase
LEASLGFAGRLVWYPGEFEMDALAEGVAAVLSGREQARSYT